MQVGWDLDIESFLEQEPEGGQIRNFKLCISIFRTCLVARILPNQTRWMSGLPPHCSPHGYQSTYGPDPLGTVEIIISVESPSSRAPPMQKSIFAHTSLADHGDGRNMRWRENGAPLTETPVVFLPFTLTTRFQTWDPLRTLLSGPVSGALISGR
jgi:hypothetical protein